MQTMRLSFEFEGSDEDATEALDEAAHEIAELDRACAMLDMLNGDKYSHLSIERDDEHRMCISGGAEQFVVIDNCELSGEKALINPDGQLQDIIEIKTFGEASDVPTLIVVGKADARDAIQCFYNGIEDQLDWY